MTVSLLQLWLPIILAAFLAWLASGLIHTVVKYHNSDYKKLENEDEVIGAIRNGAPATGLYPFPYCIDMADMKDEAIQRKFVTGPIGMVAILPTGMPKMGKVLAQQFGFFLVGCILIALCATLALEPGAQYMTVFQFVTLVGFLAFGWTVIPYSIWFGHPWTMAAKFLVDALVYGLLVAGVFAWRWPDLPA